MKRKQKPQKSRNSNHKERRQQKKQRVREWFDDNEQVFNDYKQGKIY